LVNSDSPTLPTAFLTSAARRLLDNPAQVVLGPAEDGGYFLIGMSVPHAGLFADIAWSSPAVAAQTRARAAALGLPLVEFGPWYDVDDPASLDRLAAETRRPEPGCPRRYPAPATSEFLRRLGMTGSR
ncbi:MAG: TIGR04282 family arsenosugar biosynthesis glycosyltransferase, partial [Acetobacteraceae bacterium]